MLKFLASIKTWLRTIFIDPELNDEIDEILYNKKPSYSKDWLPSNPKPYVDYYTYIQSEKWYKGYARLATIKRDNSRCVMCNLQSLTVHHITYERLGNESIDDLVVLCTACHTKTHKEYPKGSKLFPPCHKDKLTPLL